MNQLKTEQSIFLEALDMSSATERTAYLDAACADNRQLRDGVEKLIDTHLRSGDLFDVADAVAATTDSLPTKEGPGTQIGPYKLRSLARSR